MITNKNKAIQLFAFLMLPYLSAMQPEQQPQPQTQQVAQPTTTKGGLTGIGSETDDDIDKETFDSAAKYSVTPMAAEDIYRAILDIIQYLKKNTLFKGKDRETLEQKVYELIHYALEISNIKTMDERVEKGIYKPVRVSTFFKIPSTLTTAIKQKKSLSREKESLKTGFNFEITFKEVQKTDIFPIKTGASERLVLLIDMADKIVKENASPKNINDFVTYIISIFNKDISMLLKKTPKTPIDKLRKAHLDYAEIVLALYNKLENKTIELSAIKTGLVSSNPTKIQGQLTDIATKIGILAEKSPVDIAKIKEEKTKLTAVPTIMNLPLESDYAMKDPESLKDAKTLVNRFNAILDALTDTSNKTTLTKFGLPLLETYGPSFIQKIGVLPDSFSFYPKWEDEAMKAYLALVIRTKAIVKQIKTAKKSEDVLNKGLADFGRQLTLKRATWWKAQTTEADRLNSFKKLFVEEALDSGAAQASQGSTGTPSSPTGQTTTPGSK